MFGIPKSAWSLLYCQIFQIQFAALEVGQRDFGPFHYYAHTNSVTIIVPNLVSFPFYTIPICGHSQSSFTFIVVLLHEF